MKSAPAAGPWTLVRLADPIFALALLALVGYLFALPVFPTGDGPLHLYFSGVLASLAKHQPQYTPFYAIRHLIAPYSVHYFALILFESFLSQANAEKAFVVIIVVNLALSFRFLAGRLGAHAAVASLWMIPLLLNWALGGGFLNFCLAAGFCYWAFGCWIMLTPASSGAEAGSSFEAGSGRVLAGFCAALVVLVLSHPVPLLVLFLFLAGDLVLGWLEGLRLSGTHTLEPADHRSRRRAGYGLRLAAFALTGLSMLAPALIADKSQVSSSWHDLYPHLDLLRQMALGQCLGLFGGWSPLQLLYTAGLVLMVPAVVWLLAPELRARWRTATNTPADRLLILAVAYLAASLCFPHSLNGSYWFAQRMWPLVWPLVLACGASAAVSPRRLRTLALGGVTMTVITGVLAVQTLTPAARLQAQLAEAPLPPESQGIFLEPDSAAKAYQAGFTYPIFSWSGTRALAKNRDILLNSPWLGLTILPVKEHGHGRLLGDLLAPDDIEHPFILLKTMATPSRARDIALQRADFLLYADPLSPAPHLEEALQPVLEGQQAQWACTSRSFFMVCTHKR